VFVFAATPADATHPDRSRILRFTAVGDVGTAMTVIVDSLPVAETQNGGVLAFGPDGKLYATVGDTTNPDLAQTDGSRAGRILRFDDDGSIPADNPIPGDPEWCRGLRNVFGLAFHPTTGGLFASENGPAADDELDFILPGKNYEWGAAPESVPGPQVGRRMMDWSPVIVPTGIAFLGHGAFGSDYSSSLFVAGYDESDVRRLVLSGPQLTDVDDELPFARWQNTGVVNKPLDVLEAPDGSLFVSTFTAIWRISRY
jgi:glucose/arabinose dehydrogenase